MDDRIKSEGGVVLSIVRYNFVVVVTASLNVYVNVQHSRANCSQLALCTTLRSPPLAIEAFVTSTGSTSDRQLAELKVLVATEEGDLLLLDSQSCVNLMAEGGPFAMLVVSRGGHLVAGISTTGSIRVFATSNFARPLQVTSIDIQRKPRQMVWVGEDCLAVYVAVMSPSGAVQHVLYLGGPQNTWMAFQFQHAFVLCSEVDCARLITPSDSQHLIRVPHSSESIFSVGSCDPAAMLCYALERNKDSADSLKAIDTALPVAVQTCLDASLHEWTTDVVVHLLRAYLFGKSVMPPVTPRDFLTACRDLRVCFALREAPAEMALTVTQLRLLGYPLLTQLLARRRCHFLAIRICDYVGISSGPVVAHWCSEVVRNSKLSDDKLGHQIIDKLKKSPDVSVADIALIAAQSGRSQLATRLLKFEPCIKAQVLLLLKLAQVHLATAKSLSSCNRELTMLCIDSILGQEQYTANGQVDLSVLVSVVKETPRMEAFFTSFCKKTHAWNMLQRFYEQSGSLHRAGMVALTRGWLLWKAGDVEQVKHHLAFAAAFFGTHNTKGKGGDPATKFAHKAALEQIELLQAQRELERRLVASKGSGALPISLTGKPLFQSVVALLNLGENAEALKLCQQFSLAEKSWWHARIESLAACGKFEEIVTLVASKTPPSGYEPVLSVCSRHASSPSCKIVAENFVARLPEASQAYWVEKFELDPKKILANPSEGGGLSFSSLAADASTSAGGFLRGLTGVLTRKGD